MSFKSGVIQVLSVIKKILIRPRITVQLSEIKSGKMLEDKKIVITGGDRGIGLAIAKSCLKEGAEILIIARDKSKLNEAKKMLGEKCHIKQFDVTEIENIPDVMREAREILGGEISCLVCNAGISLHERNILEVSIDNYERQMKINLESCYFFAKTFIDGVGNRSMTNEKSILFVSSERGKQCDDVPYGLTKAALNSLTRGLSCRYYASGIRCNAVAPGITATDMTQIDARGDLYAERLVSKRYFLPEEVAQVVIFLLSDISKCISGEVISCDAGEYISSYFKSKV